MSNAAQGANGAPGYAKKPDYRIEVAPAGRRVRVEAAGKTIADSAAVLLMREQNHDPVYYFPRADVAMDAFRRTDHSTYCPFKGHASYWTLPGGDTALENVMWSYEAPYDEAMAIGGYVAFYRDRMDVWYEDGEPVLGTAHSK